MSDYTPSLEEAREQYWAASGDPRRDSGAWGEFDRMIETVRAEEREQDTREPSDAQLGVMAQAFYEELSTSSDITFHRMTAKTEIVRGLRAALLAAREVRNRG